MIDYKPRMIQREISLKAIYSHFVKIITCVVSAQLGLAFMTQATAAESLVLEEIVVTARKREESLQETPIAVTAFSAKDLEQRNLSNLMEAGAYAPNVSMTSSDSGAGGSNHAQIYIRGIGQSDFLFTTDPGVGIYIDGVFHPRTVGGVLDLLDLERVEILRGPQGTLFGKNTIGGAVNVVSLQPASEIGGYAQVTLGKFDRIDTRASIDLPLIEDKLFAKLSLSIKNRDGFGDRLDFNTGEKLDTGLGDEDRRAARLALHWRVSEDVTADFSFDYSHADENSVPTILVEGDPAQGVPATLWNALVGGPLGTPFDDRYEIPGNVEDSYGTGPNGSSFEGWGANGTIEWDMGWATAKSITAYRQFSAAFGRDGDGSPLPIVHTDQRQKQDQFSQEFQLFGDAFGDRLHWQAGIFYFDEFGRDENDVRLTSGLFNALESLPVQLSGAPCMPPFLAPGCTGNPINPLLDLDFDIFNEIDITSIAVFEQATFDLTDRFSITAGLRYTYEKKEYKLEHKRIDSGTFIVPLKTIDNSWREVTPMANIQYQWSDDFMLYATISEGFKSGGFNGRPVDAAVVESFDPEFVTSYEIGFKSEWLDRRVRFNGAAFYMDYEDLQVNVVSFSDTTGTLILRTDNIGAAEVQGVELELQAVLFEGLNVGGTLGYLDFEITELDPSITDISLDNKNVQTPEWTASLYAQYNWSWQNTGEFSARVDWAYEDETETNILNTPSLQRKSHTNLNARLTFDMPESGWELTVSGTNLTDKRYISNALSALTSFGTAEASYNRPREWAVTLKRAF